MRISRTIGTMRRGRRLLAMLAVVLVLAGWWVWLRPPLLGGDTTMVTVSGRSMEPGMHTGDLVLVRDTDDYDIGDVVAYRVPHADGSRGQVVIHRIVAGDPATGFVVQGDNNDFRDPWRLAPNQVTGELMIHVPGLGRTVAALRDPVMAASLLAALAAFLVLSARPREDEPKDGRVPVDTGEIS